MQFKLTGSTAFQAANKYWSSQVCFVLLAREVDTAFSEL